MVVLSKGELRNITQRRKGWCVSIFMPTHRAGREIQQDPIRFKNLLGQAEGHLLANGLPSPRVRELLKPAQELLLDGSFWRHQSDGLVVLVSSDMFRYYCLPYHFDELAVVTDRFHIKPLFRLLSGDGQYYVLALSQNQVKLFQGTRDGLDEVEWRAGPTSLAEALQFDQPEKQPQLHTVTRGPGAEHSALFHGHGVGTDDAKTNVLRFVRQVDQGVRATLQDEQSPLILAAVDYVLPIYREANTYPHLVNESIEGNPEQWGTEELHRRTWAIVRPLFLEKQNQAIARYHELVGARSERASHDLEQVVLAARHGRIETVFVAVGTHRWGAFDSDSNKIELHEEAKPGDEDLLDLAAVQAHLNGGTVYALEPDKMPAPAPLAAVFRY
jgi:hypothetical protein